MHTINSFLNLRDKNGEAVVVSKGVVAVLLSIF